MTRNETINGILNEMTLNIWYRYYELFSKHFELELVKWKVNELESVAVLELMISNKLVKILNTKDKSDITTLSIMLTKRGFRIKENDGWLIYLENKKKWFGRFVRIVALIESLVIVASIGFGFYFQSKLALKNTQLLQRIKADSLRTIDLKHSLEMKGKELQGAYQKIDSLMQPPLPKKR